MKTTLALALALTSVGSAHLAIAADHAHDAPAPATTDKPVKAKAKGRADKSAEVTLKGDMVCGKCALSETSTCQNVLKVTEGGAEAKYYLADNAVAKSNHGKVCGGSSPATVKGKVAEDGGKKTLTASEIKYE